MLAAKHTNLEQPLNRPAHTAGVRMGTPGMGAGYRVITGTPAQRAKGPVPCGSAVHWSGKVSECITQLSCDHVPIITTPPSQHCDHDCTWRWARRCRRWRWVGARRRCRWRGPAVGARRRRLRTTVSAWRRPGCCRRRVTGLSRGSRRVARSRGSRGSSRVARRRRAGWRCLGAHRSCKTDQASGKAGQRSRATSAAAASARALTADSCRPRHAPLPSHSSLCSYTVARQVHSLHIWFTTPLVTSQASYRKKSGKHNVTRDTRSCPFTTAPSELWCRGNAATRAAPPVLPALALRHQLRGQLLG